jgi:predicted TIM-barrel fold metal-dependent hydrolase
MDYDGTPGTGSAEERLETQRKDGIDAEILFGPSDVRNTAIKDRKALIALVQAFNDCLAEEYCAVAPDRLIGIPFLPNIGAEDDVAEMERCAKMGYRAVRLTTYPSGKSYPTPEDDKFWAAATAMNMPVAIHTSMSGRSRGRGGGMFRYPKEPAGEWDPRIDFVERLTRHSIHHCGSVEAVQMVIAGVFECFPRLRIYWAENNIGWIPYFLEQMDHEYETNRHWANQLFGVPPLPRRPSEYLRENAYWGFFEDPTGLRLRHEIGVNRIMWSTDFPHEVTRWPNSVKVLEATMGEISAQEKWQITAGNAIKFFNLEHMPADNEP